MRIRFSRFTAARWMGYWALAFAGGSGLVTQGSAATILPPAVTLAHCVVDSSFLDDPTSCALGSIGHAQATLTLSPFVSLSVQAASPPNDARVHGSAATATITYSFQVTGGNTGDIVPVLIATSLLTNGSDPTHGIGFAELLTHTTAAGDSFIAVCSDGTCGTTASSFFGTLSTRARSGDANTLTLFVQAGTGDSLFSESASASADPFIFIDPAFPNANRYSIDVSPGVANAQSAPGVPEPVSFGLVTLGLLVCAAVRAVRMSAHG